jgi:hypothetical protein
MTSMEKDFDMAFDTPIGKLQLRPDIHGALIEVLRRGPTTLRDAIERLPQPTTNWGSILDAIKVLVGRGDLQPALPAGGDAARAPSVRAFNAAVLERAMERAEFGYLASPVTGGAVRVDRVAQLYLFARQRGVADPAEMLAALAQDRTPTGGHDTPPSAEAGRAFAQSETARIEAHVLPVLKKLGID